MGRWVRPVIGRILCFDWLMDCISLNRGHSSPCPLGALSTKHREDPLFSFFNLFDVFKDLSILPREIQSLKPRYKFWMVFRLCPVCSYTTSYLPVLHIPGLETGPHFRLDAVNKYRSISRSSKDSNSCQGIY